MIVFAFDKNIIKKRLFQMVFEINDAILADFPPNLIHQPLMSPKHMDDDDGAAIDL